MVSTRSTTMGDLGGRNEGVPRLRLDIVREAGDWSPFEPIEAAADEVAAALARHDVGNLPATAVACVALSDDAAVGALNRNYRGYDKPTNVLSFPAVQIAAPALQPLIRLGDIVLAAETVLKEALEAGILPRHHFQHLMLHGILHLLGYDHEQAHQAVAMERTEIDILSSLGIANPYRDEEAV